MSISDHSKMTNSLDVLRGVCRNSDVKSASFEFKRMSSGVRITYEVRIADNVRMGLEFVNTKDFTTDEDVLVAVHEKVMSKVHDLCNEVEDKNG